MIGETRATSKVLNLAAAASEMSVDKAGTEIFDSDVLAKEMDSSANDKFRGKTLKERAAEISAGLSKAAKNRAAKGKVAKDAEKPSNAEASPQASQGSRVTRQQTAQNGGAQAVNKEKNSKEKTSSSSTSVMETSGEDPLINETLNPATPLRREDLVGDILSLQEQTHGMTEPPAKRAREEMFTPKPGGSQDSGVRTQSRV